MPCFIYNEVQNNKKFWKINKNNCNKFSESLERKIDENKPESNTETKNLTFKTDKRMRGII